MLMEDGENENLGFYLKKYSMLKDEGLIANLESLDDKGDDFYRNLYIKYRALLNEQYDVEDLDITQIFVYPDDDVYTNADAEEYYGGLKMFMWNMTGKAEDFEMEIYKLAPNSASWYIVALFVSAAFAVVSTLLSKPCVQGYSRRGCAQGIAGCQCVPAGADCRGSA
jgi:hypothetical protein